ncbi:MAG: serine--tRNA ligase, partial [Spirochaetes bacterium]|nr:serine--tRNA ligase [Spirochaetota bacterium]
MLTPKFVRENLAAVEENLGRRFSKIDLGEFRRQEARRLERLREGETLKAERNTVSKEIGALKAKGGDIAAVSARMREAGDRIKAIDNELAEVEAWVADFCMRLPNMVDPAVPVGADSAANVEIRRVGEPRAFDFAPKDHHALGEALGILDFERGVKLAGARFTVVSGAGARLERALINFFLDENTSRGYREVLPPFINNADSLRGTGQLPKFEEDMFKIEGHEGRYYLISTAEIPLTNLHRDEILPEASLPVKLTAYTPCFRSEAGAAGRDTRGIIRQHQFNKVEIVKLVKPEESEAEHLSLLADSEHLLQVLGLPYRVMLLSSGDMGFGGRKCYDLEVWLPGQNRYVEISSCTNFGDFQANRAGIRYKTAQGKNLPVHTLNSSALAVGRTVVALLENGQQADGSVLLPKALHARLGFDRI